MEKSNLISPILSLLLFFCSTVYSRDHQVIDKNLLEVKDLERQGRFLEAAEICEKTAQAEKEGPGPDESTLAAALNRAGYYYYLAGRYNRAVRYIEEASVIAGKPGHEDAAAISLTHLGAIYKSLGRYERAIEYLEEALEVYRRLGMEADLAARLSDIGGVYEARGQYDMAIEYYEEALDINRKPGQEDKVAADLNNIGRIYETRGRYDRAIEYYEKALDIDRNLWHEDKVATDLNNIGNIYRARGQYDMAINYYERVLDIERRLNQEDRIISQLTRISGIYEDCGRYDRAAEYLEEALYINRRLGMEADLAILLSRVGGIYEARGRYDMAIEYCEKALDIDRRLGREDRVAADLNIIGGIYEARGRYDKAIKYYEEALSIDRRSGIEAVDALNLKNLDMVYNYYWSEHDKAIKPHEQALAIKRKFWKDADISRDLVIIGMTYVLQKKYKTALKYLNESLSLIEGLRRATTGEERRDYLACQTYIYQLLASAYIRDNDIYSAFQAVELSRAKLMAERFGGSERKIRLEGVKQIQETMDEDTAIIVYANVNRDDIIQFAVTKGEFTGREISRKSFVQASSNKYHTPITALLINQRGLGEKNNDFDDIVNYYYSLLRKPQDERGQGAGINMESRHKTDVGEIGRGLYELFIKPMKAQIVDKKNLIIVPDGILAFVPFETLLDDNGQYLAENYRIGYLQSVDIRKLVMSRKYGEKRRPLLAFGGAFYEKTVYDVNAVENETQLALLRKETYTDLENIQIALSKKSIFTDPEDIPSVRNAYGALGIGTWHNLPGTLSEVNNIKRVINKSNIFTGKNVTENDIKEFSGNWTLYNHKILHFATHGLVVCEIPELSAVVLSQFEKDEEKEDGYLRMREIAELQLQADLVNLTACTAGPGRIYGGEGVMGFTQSFILAGANAVSISLWQVADESTSQFMAAMYGMVQDKGISCADAMTEVKRKFINGSFGEKYRSPYYWAPFVYYGN